MQVGESGGEQGSSSDWMDIADSSLAAFLRMLADLPDPDAVAAAIAHGSLGLFRPVVVAIGFVRLDRRSLTTEGLFGVSPELRQLYADVALDAEIPATLCYRTNAVVSASAERLAVDFPLTAPYANSTQPMPGGEFVAFPIRLRGAVIMVLGVEFPTRWLSLGICVRRSRRYPVPLPCGQPCG